jgi:hypothetical protein
MKRGEVVEGSGAYINPSIRAPRTIRPVIENRNECCTYVHRYFAIAIRPITATDTSTRLVKIVEAGSDIGIVGQIVSGTDWSGYLGNVCF